jgi:uncharacterized coiled-coil DUF342 family protein
MASSPAQVAQNQLKIALAKCDILLTLFEKNESIRQVASNSRTFFSELQDRTLSDIEITVLNARLPQFDHQFKNWLSQKSDPMRKEIDSVKTEIESELRTLNKLRDTVLKKMNDLPEVTTLEQLTKQKKMLENLIDNDTKDLKESYEKAIAEKNARFPELSSTLANFAKQINQQEATLGDPSADEDSKPALLKKISSLREDRAAIYEKITPFNAEIARLHDIYSQAKASHPEAAKLKELTEKIEALTKQQNQSPDYIALTAKSNNLQTLINSVGEPLGRAGYILKYIDKMATSLENPAITASEIEKLAKEMRGIKEVFDLKNCRTPLMAAQDNLKAALEKYKDELIAMQNASRETLPSDSPKSQTTTPTTPSGIRLENTNQPDSLDLNQVTSISTAPQTSRSRNLVILEPLSQYTATKRTSLEARTLEASTKQQAPEEGSPSSKNSPRLG